MRGINLTPEQIESLIKAYMEGGLRASANLASQYGVNRKYPYFLARDRGLKFDYGYKKGQSRLTQVEEDYRWAWARQRGAVLA